MKTNYTLCGIDEAGRGALIGPLVIAAVEVKSTQIQELKDLGIRDSKLISKSKRESIYDIIIKNYRFAIITINPEEIDKYVNTEGVTLNTLEAKKAVDLMTTLRPDSVIVDCPSVNIHKFENELLSFLNIDISLKAEHKADFNYVEVAAASILAKVTRDREIEKIKEFFNIEFGSGYPADARTVTFLKESKGNYPIFRKSWATWKRYIK